jgi:hypothetical protein
MDILQWVACQLDTLQKCLTTGPLKKVLQSLPKTLDQTYKHILNDSDENHTSSAFEVLQWLAFSACPVTLEEVAEAVAINFDNGPCFSPNQCLWDPEDLLVVCSSLVTISAPKDSLWSYKLSKGRTSDTTPKERPLQLTHFFVKKYLVSQCIQDSAASHYHINEESADDLIAQTCLTYLLQFYKLNSLNSITLLDFPLACYAADHWMVRAHCAGSPSSDALHQLIVDLLQAHDAHYFN